MKTVDIVYFNAGGGHRAAAQALFDMAERQRLPWRVRLTQLFDVLDPQQRFKAWTGMAPEAYYNARLARGWTMGLARELKVLQAGIRWLHPQLVQRLQQHWARAEPDLVVSVVPNFNRAIGESLARSLPGVPFLTVLTDLADLPPRFWIEPSVHSHVACGTEMAVNQALDLGCAKPQVHRVSGMVLRPEFYELLSFDRTQARRDVGISPEAFVGMVMFGGQGSSDMIRIAQQLAETPLILVCGHNQRLAQQLRALPARAPRMVLGFTPDIQRWMRLADFFVGKPGPGSISEAIQCGLPVVVTRDRKTMPQERFNTEWIRRQGVGLVISRWTHLPQAVDDLRAGLSGFRGRVAQTRNDATREVLELMSKLLMDSHTMHLSDTADCGLGSLASSSYA
jgi:UDP-N-acetylglucosamine:LPS N-acetylglucosamine transferase